MEELYVMKAWYRDDGYHGTRGHYEYSITNGARMIKLTKEQNKILAQMEKEAEENERKH